MIAKWIDWGTVEYEEAWQRQTELFDAAIAAKTQGRQVRNTVVFCQHPHVYTIGRSGKAQNMLLNEDGLWRIGTRLIRIDRGGDVTYHGPGQIVCYPIIDLEELQISLREYIHLLEETVIRTCGAFGIVAGRLKGATGVWIEPQTPRARKICAIGVRCSRFVTMHGLAMNVSTDLNYFQYINPCGFTDRGVTSLQQELKRDVVFNDVVDCLASVFHLFIDASADLRRQCLGLDA